MPHHLSRRSLLLLALLSGGASANAPKVDEKDSMAKALGYVSKAKSADTCSTCSWYQGKPNDAAGGACSFFPGKNVDAQGWCRMWNKKS